MPEIEDLVNYAILIAVTAAIILMITGKFIDLSVERQTSVQSRATINLLQNIVTDSPLLMKDSQGNKLKLMIDKDEYDKSGPASLTECCDSVQYGYRFGVGKDPDSESRISIPSSEIKYNYQSGTGKLEDEGSFCYTGFTLNVKSAANVPVNICHGDLNSCEQGSAYIETVNSPLAELSYWITQACSSEFDLSKRIPLSEKDYKNGNSIEVNNKDKTVCFAGTCKKFSCDKIVDADRPELVDSSLRYQNVPKALGTESCHFAKVVREGGEVSLIEAEAPAVEEKPAPAGNLFFLPEGKDAWTENDISYYSADSGYDVTNDATIIPGIGSAIEGSLKNIILKSVGLTKENIVNAPNIHDKRLYLDMSSVPGSQDCGGSRCIDMKDLGLNKIVFQAKIFTGGPGSTAYLRWKLNDVNGKCIEKDYSFGGGLNPFGSKTRDVATTDWNPFTIDLLEGAQADEKYGDCNDSEASSLSSGFNWKIKKIEWSVCERNVAGIACLTEQFDNIRALAIDNFYFEGVKNEKQ